MEDAYSKKIDAVQGTKDEKETQRPKELVKTLQQMDRNQVENPDAAG